MAVTCTCGAVSSSPANHCGKPMGSKTAAQGAANAAILTTGAAKDARAAAKAAKR